MRSVSSTSIRTRNILVRLPLSQSSPISRQSLRRGSRLEGNTVLVHASKMQIFAQSILVANGALPNNAAIAAKCLVASDLRGLESHGVARLRPLMDRIREGVLDVEAHPVVKDVTAAVAQVDGCNGFGFAAASVGMQKACEMASSMGVGLVSIKNSNHFGMSAWIAQQAIDAGMMSLVFTNSSPALPVWGGKSPLLGVSPLCCGAPGGPNMGQPYIFDMAPSVAARGKIYKALRRGEVIPLGWALDKCGNPTTDPKEALEGVMLPIGGPKGAGLALMMMVFSGVFAGGSLNVTNPYNPAKAANVSHFLLAIKPDLFINLKDFRRRMDYLYQEVVQSPKVAGVDRIYFPGEPELLVEKERLANGIPYHITELKMLNEEARRCSVTELETE